MRIYDVKKYDNKVTLTCTENGNVIKMITINIGDRLKVEPQNPLKLKHRGRICKINGFTTTSPTKAKVTFEDNNAHGRVNIEDLIAP